MRVVSYHCPPDMEKPCLPVCLTLWVLWQVGLQAAAKRAQFPKNTVYDAKRIIGRNLTSDALAQLEVSALPYAVVDLGNGSIGIKLPGVETMQTPQTVGSILLAQLKKTAEEASPWRKVRRVRVRKLWGFRVLGF